MSKKSLAILASTVLELVDLVQFNKSITGIRLQGLKLEVTYFDNSAVFIDLADIIQRSNSNIDLNSFEENIKELLQNDINLKFDDLKKYLIDKNEKDQSDNKESIINHIFKHFSQDLNIINDALSGFKENLNVADKKVLFLTNSIKELIADKENDNSLAISNIISLVNEQISTIKDAIMAELQVNLESLLTGDFKPKDGIDGTDGADGADGIDGANGKDGIDGKNGIDGKDGDEVEILNRVLEKTNEVLLSNKDEIKINLKEYLLSEVDRSFNDFKVLAQLDARDTKITNNIIDKVIKKLEVKVNKSRTLIKQEIKHGLQILKESIPIVRDGIDGKDGKDGEDGKGIKGFKGDKGEDGNGIKNAHIDNRNHLIIETTERIIDAGKINVKQFFNAGFGFNYTNSAGIPFPVGGIEIGSKFNSVDLKILITNLLYGCSLPKFRLFTIDTLVNVVEIGYTIVAGNYQVNFDIEDSILLAPDTITISQNGVVLLSNLPNDTPVTVAIAETKRNTIGVVTFNISAYDTTGMTFGEYFNVAFKYKIYYGESASILIDLTSLRANELNDNICNEYRFNNNAILNQNYKWFCYPAILGENYIFYDTETDIALILNDVVKLDIVNQYGLAVKYNCHRTLNEIHEDINIKIKNG